MKSLFSTLLCLFIGASISLAQPSGKFKSKLKKYNLEFFMPKGYDNVPIIKSDVLPNEFAISKIEADFEIRYEIRSLSKELKRYKKNLKNPTVKLVHPNYLWKSGITKQIFTLATKDAKTPKLREFSEEAFADGLIGDGGGVCFMQLAEENNLGYKYAITMVIHRNFVADLYVTFLGNDKEQLQENALVAFHAMRFAK